MTLPPLALVGEIHALDSGLRAHLAAVEALLLAYAAEFDGATAAQVISEADAGAAITLSANLRGVSALVARGEAMAEAVDLLTLSPDGYAAARAHDARCTALYGPAWRP